MLIKMIRADDGHEVDVHPTMVADYMTGGYREVADAEPETLREAETETQAEAKAPVKRGRKPKVAE